MNIRDEGKGDGAQPGAVRLISRALVVITLALLFALAVLVQPLPDPVGPASTGIQPATATSTPGIASLSEQGSQGEEAEAASVTSSAALPMVEATLTREPTPTVMPTATAKATATGTATPDATPSPSPTATLGPLATVTPTTAVVEQTATPELSPVVLAGRVEEGSYFSQVTGQAESYRIYLPPGYDEGDRRYPVLYLLHGWPYDEAHWDDLGVDEAADARIVEGVFGPFIIVLPGADAAGLYVTTSGGAQSFEEQLVNELMPHIDANYRSLQTREGRAIGGISRGGVWALEIAFRHSDAFGIVGAHSPALSANRAPPAYDPFVLLREPGVEGLRIYLSTGDADWTRQETVQLHDALQAEGIVSQLAIHPGAHEDGHWQRHLGEYLAFYTAGW